MAGPAIKYGELVTLQDLRPSCEFFKQGASLRVIGKLQEYNVEGGIARIGDGNATVKVDTQHLRNVSFRIGSVYQFIGELLIQHENEGVLLARIGRNVDGIDINLYNQCLQLLRQFQAEHIPN